MKKEIQEKTQGEVQEKNNKVAPVASLVLGIISILSFLFYYISIPTSILAICFGVHARRNTGSKLGLTGVILGIVGITMCVFIYILFITGIILSV
jgi:hypothetical protein